MITKSTPAQWAKIDALRESVIAGISDQPSDEDVRNVVRVMWQRMGVTPKAVIIADCPIVGANFFCWLAKTQLYSQLGSQLDSQLDSQLRSQLRSQLDSQLRSQLYSQLYSQLGSQLGSQLRSQLYVSIAWRAWSAWYEVARILGVKFDLKQFDLFKQWTTHVPVIYANAAIPIVSRWPAAIGWKNQRLHRTDGQAVAFRSGWGLWMINGVPVTEQIVMRPETQTIHQIDSEKNGDIRSIMIQRFGWPRYIKESGASISDERKNDIEGTLEALFRCHDGSQRLVVTCPTGRIFALGVPSEVRTCEQAQHWLAGGKNFRVLART